jgi:hypothetical protein
MAIAANKHETTTQNHKMRRVLTVFLLGAQTSRRAELQKLKSPGNDAAAHDITVNGKPQAEERGNDACGIRIPVSGLDRSQQFRGVEDVAFKS